MKKSPLDAEKALVRLEELCARSEQCSWDLKEKLRRWKVEPPYEPIIESLSERGFVNDERFARAYVRDKYRFDHWGRLKIVKGLIAKRIDRNTIDIAMREIIARDYALNCFNLLKAKRKSLSPELSSYEMKQKMLRFAAARGYEPNLVIRLLDNEKIWD